MVMSLCGSAFDHHFGDVDYVHAVNERDDPVEPGHCQVLVFAQTLNQAPAGGRTTLTPAKKSTLLD